jgi:hypothetical protein
MNKSNVINVDENSREFQFELSRRIKIAKNPQNRILLSQAKTNILKKYQKLASAKV